MWLRVCQLGALTAPHISVYWLMILTHRESDYKQLPVCLADVMKQILAGQFILTEWGPIRFCLFYLNFSGAWHFTSSKVHRNRSQCVEWVVPMFQLYQQQWTWNREENEDDFWSRLIYAHLKPSCAWGKMYSKCETALLMERNVTTGGHLTGTCLLFADISQWRNNIF